MTDLPVGDDGYLLMDQFSADDISDSELGAEDWFSEPDPLPEAAWVRIVSGAVGEADDRPDVDELVAVPEPGSGEDLAAYHDDPADDPADGDLPDDGLGHPSGHLLDDADYGTSDPGWDGGTDPHSWGPHHGYDG